MISKHLGRAAAVAIAAGMTVATPTAAALAAPLPAHPEISTVCGYLNDMFGTGTANSITPRVTPFAGEQFTQQADGPAWKMCFIPDNPNGSLSSPGTLSPQSAPGWCEANNGNDALLRPCRSGARDQTWQRKFTVGIAFHLENADGGYLCATGGKVDHVYALAQCTVEHSNWGF